MLYLASTAALCVLEVRVHLDLPFDLLPDDYVLMTIDLDALEILRAPDDVPDPAGFGDRWLGEARTPLLEVRSAIVTESTNLLLNPVHPAAARVRIETMRGFGFDPRLWSDR
jgi:RES domain-containing protein